MAESDDKKISKEEYVKWINGIEINFPYYNPAPKKILNGKEEEQFPILSGPVRYDNKTNVMLCEDMEKAEEAGFNVCTQIALGMSALPTSLENAKKAHVNISSFNQAFVDHGLYKVQIDDYLPSLGAIRVWDEPKYEEMTGVENETLQSNYYYLQVQTPPINRMVLINLVGSPASDFMKPNESKDYIYTFEDYKEYVQTFQKYFKPAYFSYDLYPITENENLLYEGIRSNLDYSSHEGAIMINELFYKNLEFFRNFTLLPSINRPFWTYCQTQSFMSLKFKHYAPLAKEQYLRFEAFSALAYGVKGLVYWSYAVDTSNSGEAFLTSIKNRRQQLTAAWHYAKKVNTEIHKYSNIFLHTTLKLVYNVLFQLELYGTKISSDIYDGILISEFQDTIYRYLMVVSKKPLDYQNLTIKTSSKTITELTPEKSGGPENVQLPSNTTVTRILIPGGYRIFRLSLLVGPTT